MEIFQLMLNDAKEQVTHHFGKYLKEVWPTPVGFNLRKEVTLNFRLGLFFHTTVSVTFDDINEYNRKKVLEQFRTLDAYLYAEIGYLKKEYYDNKNQNNDIREVPNNRWLKIKTSEDAEPFLAVTFLYTDPHTLEKYITVMSVHENKTLFNQIIDPLKIKEWEYYIPSAEELKERLFK